jgi:hypothetical protein
MLALFATGDQLYPRQNKHQKYQRRARSSSTRQHFLPGIKRIQAKIHKLE